MLKFYSWILSCLRCSRINWGVHLVSPYFQPSFPMPNLELCWSSCTYAMSWVPAMAVGHPRACRRWKGQRPHCIRCSSEVSRGNDLWSQLVGSKREIWESQTYLCAFEVHHRLLQNSHCPVSCSNPCMSLAVTSWCNEADERLQGQRDSPQLLFWGALLSATTWACRSCPAPQVWSFDLRLSLC